MLYIGKTELTKLENRYKASGYDVNLDRIQDRGKFLAPEEMHEKVKGDIEALVEICETTFEITKPGFELYIRKDFDTIVNLVKPKCYIEKTTVKQQEQIPIPKARSANNENVAKLTTASPVNIKTINIGQSTLSVTFGDLTAQTVKINKRNIKQIVIYLYPRSMPLSFVHRRKFSVNKSLMQLALKFKNNI